MQKYRNKILNIKKSQLWIHEKMIMLSTITFGVSKRWTHFSDMNCSTETIHSTKVFTIHMFVDRSQFLCDWCGFRMGKDVLDITWLQPCDGEGCSWYHQLRAMWWGGKIGTYSRNQKKMIQIIIKLINSSLILH